MEITVVIDKDDEHACPSAVHGDGGVAGNGLASRVSGDTAPRSLMVLAGGCRVSPLVRGNILFF